MANEEPKFQSIDEMIQEFRKRFNISEDDPVDWLKLFSIIYNWRNAHMSADVEPVRNGRWIRVQWIKDEDWQEGGYWILRCSECLMPYHNPTPHCPHCGAKMSPEPPKEEEDAE